VLDPSENGVESGELLSLGQNTLQPGSYLTVSSNTRLGDLLLQACHVHVLGEVELVEQVCSSGGGGVQLGEGLQPLVRPSTNLG